MTPPRSAISRATWPSVLDKKCVNLAFHWAPVWEHSPLLGVTLFTFRVNVDHGESEERNMITGLHTVRDISCSKCKTIVGWTYVSLLYAAVYASRGSHWPTFPFHSQVKAVEESQKYKEGKFILEKALLEKLAEVAWMMIPFGLSFFRLSPALSIFFLFFFVYVAKSFFFTIAVTYTCRLFTFSSFVVHFFSITSSMWSMRWLVRFPLAFSHAYSPCS